MNAWRRPIGFLVPADRTRIVVKATALEVDQLRRRVMVQIGKLNLTLDDLAVRLGVSRPRVSRLINSPEITRAAFDRLSVALGVDDGWWSKPIARQVRKRSAARVLRDRAKKTVACISGAEKA